MKTYYIGSLFLSHLRTIRSFLQVVLQKTLKFALIESNLNTGGQKKVEE